MIVIVKVARSTLTYTRKGNSSVLRLSFYCDPSFRVQDPVGQTNGDSVKYLPWVLVQLEPIPNHQNTLTNRTCISNVITNPACIKSMLLHWPAKKTEGCSGPRTATQFVTKLKILRHDSCNITSVVALSQNRAQHSINCYKCT